MKDVLALRAERRRGSQKDTPDHGYGFLKELSSVLAFSDHLRLCAGCRHEVPCLLLEVYLL